MPEKWEGYMNITERQLSDARLANATLRESLRLTIAERTELEAENERLEASYSAMEHSQRYHIDRATQAEARLETAREIFNRYARINTDENPGWIGNFLGELRKTLTEEN